MTCCIDMTGPDRNDKTFTGQQNENNTQQAK